MTAPGKRPGPARATSSALALTAILLTACGPQGAGEPSLSPKRTPAEHLVSAVEARLEQTQTTQERPGTLRHRRLVRIYSQEEGRVTALALFEGDAVEQGQTLVRTEDALLRAELDKARATEAQKRLDLERQEDLSRKRAVSEDEVAQARTALAVAEADRRLLETRLGFTNLSAPFPGVITERLVEPGDFVTKNTHLLTLADPGSLVAEVYASELILPQLQVGDAARARIDALGSLEYEARILRIHPKVEESSRQGIVELALDPIPAGARAGQFVRVQLASASLERLMVPFHALRRDRDGEHLWVIGPDGVAARRAVKSGLRIADGIEIRDGLAPGERVITRGFLGLSAGKRVQVVAD